MINLDKIELYERAPDKLFVVGDNSTGCDGLAYVYETSFI